MPRFTPQRLLDFSARVLAALGSSGEGAGVVAEHLVSSNLAGHDSHGVLRLLQYAQHVREGKIQPSASPRVVRETESTAVLDGSLAWGQVVAKRAVDLAAEKARDHGVAAVAVRNCYHVGRVGVYPLLAARAGFIAQVFCNGHGIARVAPWGGTDARLATNPVALAVPTRGEPVLVDITTSVVAEGKVRVAHLAGKPVPEGWILDRDGKPTTDPADLYDGGTILPFGGREGHKGYGLSVMVDLLGGILGGAGAGVLTKAIGNGLLITVVDPVAFDDREAFLDRVEEFLAYLRSSRTKPGVDGILLPGEPELRTEARRRREGIEIDAGTLAKLADLARGLGIEPPRAMVP
jgi:uncharacterized oxidoreductase